MTNFNMKLLKVIIIRGRSNFYATVESVHKDHTV